MGINDPDTNRKHSAVSGKVLGRTPTSVGVTNHAKKQKIEVQTEALFAMVNDMEEGFLKQTNCLKALFALSFS